MPASTADGVLPSAFYHFAFEAGSDGAIEQKRQELVAKGIKVTEVIDQSGLSRYTSRIPTEYSWGFAALRATSRQRMPSLRSDSRVP